MPIELIPPREGLSSNWRIRGTYLKQYVDRSTGTSDRGTARKVLKDIEHQIEIGEFSKSNGPTFASVAANYMKAGGECMYFRQLLLHFGETPIGRIDQEAIDRAAETIYPQRQPGHTQPPSLYADLGRVAPCWRGHQPAATEGERWQQGHRMAAARTGVSAVRGSGKAQPRVCRAAGVSVLHRMSVKRGPAGAVGQGSA